MNRGRRQERGELRILYRWSIRVSNDTDHSCYVNQGTTSGSPHGCGTNPSRIIPERALRLPVARRPDDLIYSARFPAAPYHTARESLQFQIDER